jgi:hypothetical protein
MSTNSYTDEPSKDDHFSEKALAPSHLEDGGGGDAPVPFAYNAELEKRYPSWQGVLFPQGRVLTTSQRRLLRKIDFRLIPIVWVMVSMSG